MLRQDSSQLGQHPSAKRKIATEKEWGYAKTIIAQEKRSGHLYSGYKISRHHHLQLRHSFFYFCGENKECLVSFARNHYIGKGNEGAVKVAEDEMGRRYAVKISEFGLRENECNILKLLGLLHFKGKSLHSKNYILQTYFRGINLSDYLASKPLDQNQKLIVALLIAKAIQRVHNLKPDGIIHRDNIPGNFRIYVGYDHDPKNAELVAIDFGMSKLAKKPDDFAIDIDSLRTLFKTDLKIPDELLNEIFKPLDDKLLPRRYFMGSFHISDINIIVKNLERYNQVLLLASSKYINRAIIHFNNILASEVYVNLPSTYCKNTYLFENLKYTIKLADNIFQLEYLYTHVKEKNSESHLFCQETHSYMMAAHKNTFVAKR